MVYNLEEARAWFLRNVMGSITCFRSDGQSKACWSFPEAEEFYGVVASPEQIVEKYGIGSCCGSCSYWIHTSRNTPASQTARGMCKRFPPSGHSNMWPETLGREWCGEYCHAAYSSYAAQPWPEK